MLKVAKFGGSSLADAARFLRVRDIVLSDPDRRVVVVSAPGKRHAADHKITDLLCLCHAHLQYGVSCWDLFRRIRERFCAIRDGCGLQTAPGPELDAVYAALSPASPRDELISRGEYFSARLMAELLGFDFVDAADWLRFDEAGRVLERTSFGLLRARAEGRRIVTPGFYGAFPDGRIHTLPRGGSDVTGSLAAAALQAELCENWTDVPGVLRADPRIVEGAEAIPELTWGELQLLSGVGLQVLHEDAAAPLRAREIPLRVCSSFDPDAPGTLIRARLSAGAPAGAVGFAGRGGLTLAELLSPEPAGDLQRLRGLLASAGVPVWLQAERPDGAALLLQSGEAVRAALARAPALLPGAELRVREDMSLLAGLLRGGRGGAEALDALRDAGIPVPCALLSGSCLLAAVAGADYPAALRATAK